MFDLHDPQLIWAQIQIGALVLLTLVGVIGTVIYAIRKRSARPSDLQRPENCQRCGRRSKWLYFCECVHDDENINHSLHVVKRALERKLKKDHILPKMGIQLLDVVRTLLEDEIERTKL